MNEYADLKLFPTLYHVISALRIYPISLVSPAGTNIKASYLTDEQRPAQANFQLIWIEAGEGYYRVNDRDLWADPGSLFLLTPDDVLDPGGLAGTQSWQIVFEADLST